MSTNRLKKAIENSENGGFGNLLEQFVTYGTALPSLAEKKDSNAFVPLWEQEVRDEQGRKRLHGAFTGGWSAGHFNTVGSKEGWTPSTFKSSRAVRSKAGGKSTSEAAEAFMDAEDLADLAEARTLQTSEAYAAPVPAYDPLLGNLGTSTSTSNSTVEATAALASLIQPSSSRIGAKLMRKMGWRDGQGVGPRITVEQRKKQAFELGIKIDEAEMYDGLDEASKHYYAPLDRPLASLKEVGVSTDKGWGLGYKSGPTLSRGGSNSSEKSTARAVAFDDDDEEDEVYSKPSAMTTLDAREKKKWGIVDLDDENDNYRISSSSSRKAQVAPSRSKNYGQSFHDGTSILAGFSLNEERTPIPSTSQLPMPPPRDWKPNPQRIWDEAENANGKGKGRQLDADERGNLLGEPQPAPLQKSVFEYLSSKSKERLANLTNPEISSNFTRTSHSASSSNSVPLGNSRMGSTSIPVPEPEPDVPLLIPQLDGPTALAALKGFQPFSNSSTSPDAMRQARYTLYLQFQAHLLPPSNATLPFGPRKFQNGTIQTISELNKELDDYVKAARVFKPVTGMLAGRFTSGGSGVILPPTAAIPGFYQPAPKPAIVLNQDGSIPSTTTNESEPERLTPAQQAVRNNMFGHETRSVENWRPARLICKRFGVVVPYSADVETNGEEEEVVAGGAWKEAGSGRGDWGKRTGAGEVLGRASMDILMQSSGFRKLQPAPEENFESIARNGSNDQQQRQSDSSSTTSKPVTIRSVDAPSIANVGLGDDESQGAETLTYTKAPKDIFAAIFADSDDEDEDDSDDEEEVKPVVPVKSAISKPLTIEAPPIKSTSTPVDPSSTSDSLPLSGAKPLADSLEESNATLDSISISTYRPNFVPTSARTTKDSTKEDKKKSKKRKAKATLSFDVEDGEDGEDGVVVEKPVKKEPKKRKVEEKKAEAVEEEAGEDVWQEVPALAATSNIPEAGKRIRASDLY